MVCASTAYNRRGRLQVQVGSFQSFRVVDRPLGNRASLLLRMAHGTVRAMRFKRYGTLGYGYVITSFSAYMPFRAVGRFSPHSKWGTQIVRHWRKALMLWIDHCCAMTASRLSG
jgi:hypothetical protein